MSDDTLTREQIINRALGDELVRLLDERRQIEADIALALLRRVCVASGVDLDATTPYLLVGQALLDLLERRRQVEGDLYVTFVNRLYSAHPPTPSEPSDEPPAP